MWSPYPVSLWAFVCGDCLHGTEPVRAWILFRRRSASNGFNTW